MIDEKGAINVSPNKVALTCIATVRCQFTKTSARYTPIVVSFIHSNLNVLCKYSVLNTLMEEMCF